MRTHILADDVVHVDLTADEHVALSGAIRELVEALEPDETGRTLGLPTASACAFADSIGLLEYRGLQAGVDWLVGAEERTGDAVFDIVFDESGCSWRITLDQLLFVEACAAEEHRRGERERQVTVDAA